MSVQSVWVAWILILVSGLLEVVFATAMKLSDGFSRWPFGLLTIVAGSLSVWVLSLTLKTLPLGVAYAVWGGIGTVGSMLVGWWWFGEALSLQQGLCIGLIVAGVLGLQLL